MKKENEFLKGFKQGLGIFGKGSIIIILDEWCFNMNELIKKVIEHLKNGGNDCSYIGISSGKYIILLNGKKYCMQLSTYGNAYSIAPCQKVILIPEK